MLRRLAPIGLVLMFACGDASSPAKVNGDASDPPNAGPSDREATPAPSAPPSGTNPPAPNAPPATTGRDWKNNPAIADAPAPATVYALSDVHGGYDRLTNLLLTNGILAATPASPSDAHWNAGGAMLVVTGDMIDKGPSGLDVLDFLMALQSDAKNAGGRVIVTLGNHEAEFLVDPMNSKASAKDGIDTELQTEGVLPASLASPSDPRGAWLRSLPFGARVGGWFFSHAGDTQGRTLAVLEATLEAAIAAHPDYDDPEIVGASSILESRSWYSSAATAPQNAAALGVKHIVFGHDPSALGSHAAIAVDPTKVLLRIDCGMSPDVDYSSGMILRITPQGSNDVVEQLDAKGKVTSLFTSPR